ncbi:MAG: thiol-disulfide isomerase/thioredoxin [Planctomycetota bacterium]|jgi:thiol-disulfide isomerase/thioredoxin
MSFIATHKYTRGKRFLWLLLVAVIALLVFVNLPKPDSLTVLPGFVLETHDGVVIDSTELAGRPMVITLWAPWCPFCINELAKLAQMQYEFADEVVIMAVVRSGDKQSSRDFAESVGVLGDLIFLVDPDDLIYDAVRAKGLPTTLFVREDGTYYKHNTPIDLAVIRASIRELTTTATASVGDAL